MGGLGVCEDFVNRRETLTVPGRFDVERQNLTKDQTAFGQNGPKATP